MYVQLRLQCFPPTHYVRGVVMRTYERDDHYPTCSMHASRHCVATSCFLDSFFSASYVSHARSSYTQDIRISR